MKRFHIHVGVKNLKESIRFYSTLFGQNPTKLKPDYAKWMLDNPRLNFAISTRVGEKGVDHLGIQVDEPEELEELVGRLKQAELRVFGEGETTCCYAESKKAWVRDPSGLAWEAYHTMADAEVFRAKDGGSETACCTPSEDGSEGCCG
jgi:catechol 2,3-dioxygenase-like lactoylglutathione lyase family enzyme